MKLWADIKGMFGDKAQAPQEAAAPPSATPAPPEDPAAANEREKRLDDNELIAKQDAERDAPDDAGRFVR
jgi:hypothetical protein